MPGPALLDVENRAKAGSASSLVGSGRGGELDAGSPVAFGHRHLARGIEEQRKAGDVTSLGEELQGFAHVAASTGNVLRSQGAQRSSVQSPSKPEVVASLSKELDRFVESRDGHVVNCPVIQQIADRPLAPADARLIR